MVHSNKRRREFDEDQDTGPKRTQWTLTIGTEVQVEITQGATVFANDGHEPPTNDTLNHKLTYVYIIEYDSDGSVNESSETNDWISVGGAASFALENLVRVMGVSSWGGYNPYVTETKVRGVDNAN